MKFILCSIVVLGLLDGIASVTWKRQASNRCCYPSVFAREAKFFSWTKSKKGMQMVTKVDYDATEFQVSDFENNRFYSSLSKNQFGVLELITKAKTQEYRYDASVNCTKMSESNRNANDPEKPKCTEGTYGGTKVINGSTYLYFQVVTKESGWSYKHEVYAVRDKTNACYPKIEATISSERGNTEGIEAFYNYETVTDETNKFLKVPEQSSLCKKKIYSKAQGRK